MSKEKDLVNLYINICLNKKTGKNDYEVSSKPKGLISVGPIKKKDPVLFAMPEKVIDEAWSWLHT